MKPPVSFGTAGLLTSGSSESIRLPSRSTLVDRAGQWPGFPVNGPSPVTVAGAVPDFHRLPFAAPLR